ncbi:HlyD family secretion protein [Salegentibacter salegens]|uniref:HlyD family secretion protein n=1 Tax=Salegentibacter salegens TaxID=143223 RepID=A0A1M7KWW6_9FLAO|nr:HlyD family efflux transporter periplasmic adaptor subunit [Salegentibacter salegens]PRX43829.1 HlyD family secretion protein [Salegentibacter salegens]SHM69576.1 HlyD family secretion protein [Salegentibacter salegens]
MKSIKIIIAASVFSVLISCSDTEKADGYGNFEATEITVSAEANGKLQFLEVDEGEVLEKGLLVGLVDTLQLYLNKQQLLASKETVASKSGGVWSQVSVFQEQLQTAKSEQQRVKNMFDESAATQRQLDQANSQVDVLKKQIKNVETQNSPILNEVKSIEAKIAQINDQIKKSKIENPLKGTVLTQYVEASEIVSFGRPLYKIADLSLMTLRVYVSEPQLANIKIGQEVTVKIDAGEELKSYSGKIDWISDTSEFTPKIIQTKEERANLVYAVTIKIKNDGSLKIGMPAEMWIN